MTKKKPKKRPLLFKGPPKIKRGGIHKDKRTKLARTPNRKPDGAEGV